MENTSPKLCYTASGVLIVKNKVLLIKHKKLGVWLCPGGHVDEDELPHQSAEREFEEETGIKVKVVDVLSCINYKLSLVPMEKEKVSADYSFVPSPFATNLHWINIESYRLRMKNKDKTKRVATKLWSRGCEQHLNFSYLVKPVASLKFTKNTQETTDIKWFSVDELSNIHLYKNVEKEVLLAYKFDFDKL